MTKTLEIDLAVYKALEESFGEAALKHNLNELLISAIQNKLESYTREILLFEAKYGLRFDEFAQLWNDGKVEDPYSYEVESDFIDWEMLEMEKKDLIAVIGRVRKSMR